MKPGRLLEEVVSEDYDALAIPGGFEGFGFYEEAYSEQTGRQNADPPLQVYLGRGYYLFTFSGGCA